MKGDNKPSFYLSAYRLKTLEKAASSSNDTTQSPYLKALLAGKTKTVSRVRVFPMINPYKVKHAVTDQTEPVDRLPDSTLNEKNWFHNHE